MSEEGTKDRPGNNHYLFNLIKKYSTGWVACSDWTNRHLGDTPGGNCNHGLDSTLEDLMIKFIVSTDGTDATSFMIHSVDTANAKVSNLTFFYIDNDNIRVQTATDGIRFVQDDGTTLLIDNESWYYKIVVYKITCKEYYSE